MYEIHDSYGLPQCGKEVKAFEDNEDVYNCICEGYATIIECD